MHSPTRRQIVQAETICANAGINDFPSCSKEFNFRTYADFIRMNKEFLLPRLDPVIEGNVEFY